MKLLILSCLLLVYFFSFSQSTSFIAEQEKKGSTSRLLDNGIAYTSASSDFTTDYARCRWNIDPAVNAISGSVLYHFAMTKEGDNIVFDLDNALTVDSIVMHDSGIPFLQSANKTLTLSFPQTLKRGTKDSLAIFYHGTPPSNGFGSFTQTIHGNGIPVLWTLSEPYGARDWWPCRNGLDDKIDSLDIYITHPSQYAASANGLLTDTITANGYITTHFRHRYPIATYLVGIAVTNYQTFSHQLPLQNGTMPVTTTVYPESLAYYQTNIPTLYNALQLYDQYFGPYPFADEHYGQTQFGWGGGMEHQSNSFVTNADQYLMAHELGHQWFGDKVTTGSWRDIWLNEGFATYLADFFYTEHFLPDNLPVMAAQSVTYATADPHGSVWVGDTTNVSRIFNYNLTYKKGAMMLRMLRWTLGDSLFFKGIRQYIDDPALRYNFARTGDLQRNLETASGKKLDYFFNQWFYGKGYPSFLVQWNWQNGKLYLQVNETTSDPSVLCFTVPLQLRFKSSSGSKDIVVNIKRNITKLALPLSFKPDTVLIDPMQYLVSKDNVSKKGNLVTLLIDKGLLLYPNPAHDVLTIRLAGIDTILAQTVRVVSSSGVVVYNKRFTSIFDNTIRLPVSYLPKGVYFLLLEDERGNVVKKKFIRQ